MTLLLAGILLGLVNAVVRPFALLLSLPALLITLGLFLLVVNAAMLGLVALMLPVQDRGILVRRGRCDHRQCRELDRLVVHRLTRQRRGHSRPQGLMGFARTRRADSRPAAVSRRLRDPSAGPHPAA